MKIVDCFFVVIWEIVYFCKSEYMKNSEATERNFPGSDNRGILYYSIALLAKSQLCDAAG